MTVRCGAMTFAFQQFSNELDSRPAVAPRIDQNVDDVAVLVHGPPQILPLPLDGQEEFVEVPRVAQATSPAPQSSRVVVPDV